MANEIKIVVRTVDATDLDKIKNDAKKVGDDVEKEFEKSGERSGQNMSKGASKGLKAGMPSLLQVAIGAGVILAPELGALIAAGVIGTAGGLGIAGGLVLAAKDARVKTAASSLGDEVNKDLTEAASGFVPVALTSIGRIQGAFRKMLPDIQGIFSDSSKLVGPLLDGFLTGTEKVVSGIRSAVSRAEPVFQGFGALASNVGSAIGDMFENMGEHAEEGASAVNDLSTAIVGTINATSAVVGGLATFKGWIDDSQAALYKWMDGLEQNDRMLHLNASGYDKNSEALALYREGLIGAKGAADDYDHYTKKLTADQNAAAGAADNQAQAMSNLASEMTAATDPVFAMIKGQRDVASAQSKYNQALKEHGPRSAQARDALDALGQAAFALNGKVSAAAGSFNGTLTPAMKQALHNAGLSTSQMNALQHSLQSSAAAAHAWEGTFTQRFKTIFSTSGRETVDLSGHRTGGYKASGGIAGAANGATSGGLTWVGEHGPELMELPAGTSVKSNPDSVRMAGGGGAQVIKVLLSFDPSRAPAAMAGLMEGLRAEIKGQTGGNVQLALGQ